ncbi:hypothetical protein Bca52824_015212 [Brassica carinata]|uniref:Uncharacterized protein n=1 Tax=Brassica carinata TaxID=52824 RepID=A0A8X8B2Z4_BRACI|nr:hypothetical protein Bca52824_015212 [Brassica carinata]
MNGISTRCPCGGDIQTDITLPPKYRHDFDTHPGLRFFTRMKYEDDGMHVRQPWALGVEDEVRRLRRETDVTPNPKYRHDFDTLPGSRYFTCKNYEDDGMHFRQPWVCGVEEEVGRLRREVKDMAEEIAKLKRIITSTYSQASP